MKKILSKKRKNNNKWSSMKQQNKRVKRENKK